MQLTKDDIKTDNRDYRDIQYLNFSKFQQVVEFYKKHKGDLNSDLELYKHYNYPDREVSEKLQKEYLKCSNGLSFKDWLFNYCFKDGLK